MVDNKAGRCTRGRCARVALSVVGAFERHGKWRSASEREFLFACTGCALEESCFCMGGVTRRPLVPTRWFLSCLGLLLFASFGARGAAPRNHPKLSALSKMFQWVGETFSGKSTPPKTCLKDEDCDESNFEECFFDMQTNGKTTGRCLQNNVCVRYVQTSKESKRCISRRQHCKTTADCNVLARGQKTTGRSICVQDVELDRGHCEEEEFDILKWAKKLIGKIVDRISLDDVPDEEESGEQKRFPTLLEFATSPEPQEDPSDDPMSHVLEGHEKDENDGTSFVDLLAKLGVKNTPKQNYRRQCKKIINAIPWECNDQSVRDQYLNKGLKKKVIKVAHILIQNTAGQTLAGAHITDSFLKRCTAFGSRILKKGFGFELHGSIVKVENDYLYNYKTNSSKVWRQDRVPNFRLIPDVGSADAYPRKQLTILWRHLFRKNLIGVSSFPGKNKYDGVIDMNPFIKRAAWQCGWTLAHEIGHSMGLLHSHRSIEQLRLLEAHDQCACGEFPDNAGASSMRGDFCGDTAPEPNMLKTASFIKSQLAKIMGEGSEKPSWYKNMDAATQAKIKKNFETHMDTGIVDQPLQGIVKGYVRWWLRRKAKVSCDGAAVAYTPDWKVDLGWNLMSYGKFGQVLTKQQKARAMCFADRAEGLKNIFGEVVDVNDVDEAPAIAKAAGQPGGPCLRAIAGVCDLRIHCPKELRREGACNGGSVCCADK